MGTDASDENSRRELVCGHLARRSVVTITRNLDST
jgi:hypothetical protein